MSFDPETAAIRFGTGLAPDIAAPTSVENMLARLSGPDEIAKLYKVDTFSQVEWMLVELRRLNKIIRKNQGTTKADEAKEKKRALAKKVQGLQADWLKAQLARGAYTDDGLRERLVRFWADHFTVIGKRQITRNIVSTYVEEAIRPNITGRFADLLRAATFHPMMLHFLDQIQSAGPNSRVARRKEGRGLNENLAREVLELHTLGVGGAYSQKDVRALAELFAGLTYRFGKGFTFAPNMAEPGAEEVLGKSYGSAKAKLRHITEFLNDLAVHPDTARHLARKLVVHFVSENPDQALIDHVAAAYQASDGDLMAMYSAMLSHPSAWEIPGQKVKQPIDFIISSMRALGMGKRRLNAATAKNMRRGIAAPMALMGQAWENPTGPDGWSEAAIDWITPQGLAARIQWAMIAPIAIRPDLPDPRSFVDTALGARASDALRFAVAGAEKKSDGIGLILASPEFQRN